MNPTQFDDIGRARLLPNVLSGWVAQAVALVVGFVMPRLIDHSVGPAALGVWDLGWSLTTYVTFSGLGMAAAITHNVARYSADGLVERLRDITATGFYCQLALALGLGAALAALFAILPAWAPDSFGAIRVDVLWVGIYLGLSIVVGLSGDVAQGVLTGCHRTSWNEYVTIGADIALAVAMIAALFLGAGIVGLAMTTLLVRLVSELLRLGLAFVACPYTSLNPTLWHLADAQRLVWFSGKSSLGVLQEVVVHQSVRVLLAASAGPVALACYSRYQTVVRQIARLVDRSARVIPPIASGLAGRGQLRDIQRLRARASKATVMAVLPMIVIFAVFGDELVRLWMGPDFVVPGVARVLALMALVHIDYGISSRILAGMDAHGRVAAICFAASVLIFALLYALLRPLSVLEAAWLVTIVMGAGVSLPHYFLSCAKLSTPPWAHFKEVYLPAVIVNSLFLIGLTYVRRLALNGASGWAAVDGLACLLLLVLAYWQFGLSRNMRSDLLRLLRVRRSAS